jgi:glycosyltransferase 2 family protein
VKSARQLLGTLGRAALCVLLLAWVFQTIFLREGRQAWESQGRDWSQLSRAGQWREAWTYGPAELAGTLRQLDTGEALLSFAVMGLTILIGAIRWRMVLRAQSIALSLPRTLEISLVAHFFNSFLLGSTGGDLMKAYYAARETQHLKTEAVMTVVVDRLIGLLSMLLFAALMMLPNLQLLAKTPRFRALALGILLMLTGGLTVAGLSFRSGLSRRWPKARAWLRRLPKSDLLERALDAMRHFRDVRGFFLGTFAVSMLLNVFAVCQFWVLAHALQLAIAPSILFMLVPTIICISALPITPNGLGVRENLYVWTLAIPAIAAPATKALSLSLLAYAGSLAWSIIGGVVYVLFRSRHRLREVVQEPASAPPN